MDEEHVSFVDVAKRFAWRQSGYRPKIFGMSFPFVECINPELAAELLEHGQCRIGKYSEGRARLIGGDFVEFDYREADRKPPAPQKARLGFVAVTTDGLVIDPDTDEVLGEAITSAKSGEIVVDIGASADSTDEAEEG